MKTLTGKVRAVRRVYLKLDREIAGFQKHSGLNCIGGCGECCKKPDIEATPIEFLPLALRLYDEGRAEKVYEEIRATDAELCYMFRQNSTHSGGLCSEYADRGLICRLFGFSARKNKEGRPELVTCRYIKEEQAAVYEEAIVKIRNGKHVPVMSNYYSLMRAIDPSLADFYPINQAILKALEVVMSYYAYRRRKRPKPVE
ncbi:MAG: YkgJ family cysteine cluster protein [Crocinitomicaceae bacterium]|nr:YkgJ family cysteine cluster protein [Crocinitomicaceae bacterium]